MASNANLGGDMHATNLVRARTYYSEKQYPKAAAIFKQVANSCVCDVQVRLSACCCKSLVTAIANSDVEAELRKKCICSAKSDVRCKNANHVDALDGLAAIYEAKNLIDKAILIAEATINLAPREPKGFLRLGRLLRLQRSYRLAFQTYMQGIDLVGKKNPSHPLLSTLRQMRDKIKYSAVATDPLPLMPLELVALIFRYLDFRSLCKCLRVSKSWNNLLTIKDDTIQSLWRVQHFDRHAQGVRLATMQKYAAYSGSRVSELVVKNCHQFSVDPKMLRWIATSCHNLKILRLQTPNEMKPPDIDRTISVCVPQLTSLYIGFHAPFIPDFVDKIITTSATTLRELSILNSQSAGEWLTKDWPVLQNLRVFRLGAARSNSWTSSVNIEVWLEGVLVRNEAQQSENIWCHLKKLFVGRGASWQHMGGALFPLPPDIEELHLMNFTHRSILSMQSPDTYPEYTNLRKFTLRNQPMPYGVDGWPVYLQKCVRPGLESGLLKELGMMFSKPHPHWLRSDTLTFLNLKGLSLAFGTDPYAIDEAFTDLLDRFPHLECLDIAREPFSNAALARAVQRGVKIIYHRGDYHMRTDVREWAHKNHGARIVEGDHVHSLSMAPPDERYMDFY